MKLWYLSLFVLLLIYKSFGEEGVVLNEDSEALVVEDENIKKTHTTKEAIDDIDVHHELDHKHQKHDIKKPAKTIRRTESNEEKVKLNDKKPTKSSEKVVVQEVKKVQKIKDDKTQKEEVVQEVKKVSKIKDDKTQKEEKNIKKDQPIHKENEQNPINKTEYIEQEAHWKGKKPKETIEKIPIKHGKHGKLKKEIVDKIHHKENGTAKDKNKDKEKETKFRKDEKDEKKHKDLKEQDLKDKKHKNKKDKKRHKDEF